jgi:hypothetical protein
VQQIADRLAASEGPPWSNAVVSAEIGRVLDDNGIASPILAT